MAKDSSNNNNNNWCNCVFCMREKVLSLLEQIGCYAIVVISIVSSFITVFYGLDLKDTFYHGCNFLYANQVNTFLPLTQCVYILMAKLFGDHIIVYRIVNWVIYFLSYIIAFNAISSKTNKRLTYLLLSAAILHIPMATTNVFNGNSLTVLFITLSFISIYKISENNNRWIFVLGISIACAILSRFPNIVLIPLILIGSIFLNRNVYLRILIAIIFSILIYICSVCIIHGGFTEYIVSLKNVSAKVTSDTAGANHSISFLFSEYLHTLKDMVSNIKYLAIITIIPLLSFISKKIKYIFPVIFLVANAIFVYFRVNVVSDVIHYFLIVYLYSGICIIIFLLCMISLLRRKFRIFSCTILVLLLSISAAVGSDTGLCLMGGPLFALTPWLISTLHRDLKSTTKEELFTIIISLIGLAVAAALYVRNGQMIYGIVLFVLIFVAVYCYRLLVVPFSQIDKVVIYQNYRCVTFSIGLVILFTLSLCAYAKFHKSFHDAPIAELNTQYNIPQLKYIRTNHQTCEYIRKVIEEYNTIKSSSVVYFFGGDSAVFSYLMQIGLIPGVDFTQLDTPRNREAIKHVLNSNPILILCAANPVTQYYTLDEYIECDELLHSYGYECEEKEFCKIYKKL